MARKTAASRVGKIATQAARKSKGMQSEYLYAEYIGEGSAPGLSDIEILGETFTDVPRTENAFAAGMPVVTASVDNTFGNFNTAVHTPTDPAPEITVVTGCSGIIRFDQYTLQDADNPEEENKTDVEVRETDETGTIVWDADGLLDGGISAFWNPDFPQSTSHYGWRLLELDPFTQYWAQMQHWTQNTDMDINHQKIVGVPLSGNPTVGATLLCLRTKNIPLLITGVVTGTTI